MHARTRPAAVIVQEQFQLTVHNDAYRCREVINLSEFPFERLIPSHSNGNDLNVMAKQRECY